MPEEWGVITIYRKISAKAGIGLDDLLETILLAAEFEELKAKVLYLETLLGINNKLTT